MFRSYFVFPLSLLILLALVGCSTPASTPDVAAIYTSVAGTMIAQMPTRPPTPTIAPLPTDTPAPTQPPTPSGQTRSDPVPGSKGVDIGSDMHLTLLSLLRPANNQVAAGNMFNATPSPDLEYAIVQIRVDCGKSQNDKCDFFPSEIKSVGSNGQVHEMGFIAGVPGQLDQAEYQFFGGSKIEGALVYLFSKNDNQVVLFHESLLFGNPIYIALQ